MQDLRQAPRDERGRVCVWVEGEPRWRHPIDAATLLQRGATLDQPGTAPALVEAPESYDFDQHPLSALRGFAKQAGVDVPRGLNKAGIVEALNESGWRPQG